MYQRILVAVDGSKTSDRALAEAISLAKDQHASLLVVYAVDERGVYTGSQVIDPAPLVSSWVEAGRRILDQSAELALKSGVRAETRLIENADMQIADAILQEAKDGKADLLVAGTHGRSGLTHLLMGSVAEGIIRASSIPILLVRGKASG